MSYPARRASRRSRRRLITTILVLIAVTVGLIALVVRLRTERRDSRDYLAAAKEIAEEQVGMSGSLADLLDGLEDLERQDILARVSDLDVEFQVLQRDLDQVRVTAAVGEANGYFKVAMNAWGEALADLDDSILEIIDGEDDGRLGEVMLNRALENLRVGDRAYDGFRGAVGKLDEDLRPPGFPEFAYVDPDRDQLYDATAVADRLRRTLRFIENRDVSIVATTEPEPLGANGGIPVIPNSEFFAVRVVVTNGGNVPAELITVSLTLTEVNGDGFEERSEIVAALEPGEATTVPFEDIVLTPGSGYELRVVADLTDDDEPDNNVWELDFLRNEL